jgi:carboxypeptidase Q
MCKTLLSIVILAAFGAHAARAEQDLASLRELALKDQRAYAVLESLTTEVGPRLAGSAADKAAVAWAQAKMKALGFDKVYTEKVSYPAWVRDGASSAEVISPFPQNLTIAALGGSVGTGKDDVTAQVVSFDSFDALSKAAAGSAAGKIVFINQKMARSRDGSGYGAAVTARVAGASAAAKIGAKALLIRSIGTDAGSRTPHTGVLRYDAAQPRIPAAALSYVDADLLARMLTRGKPVTLRLQVLASVRAGEYSGVNVIGEITGSTLPKEIVAIGGHLDSWDLGTGAIDDGAGVAMTMAAASLIGEQKTPPKRTIRVVLFANEEQGVYGGKAYAAARKAADEVKLQVIAAESDFGSGRVYQLATKLPEAQLASLAPLFDALKPLGITQGDNKGSGSADFGPMGELGAPVADLKQDGTEYFDFHHTANDTLDKVKPEDLAQNVAAWAVFARFFADRD